MTVGRTALVSAALLCLTACAQSQSVGFTGIGSEGAGFGRGAITEAAGPVAVLGPAPDAATYLAALSTPPLDTVETNLAGDFARISRVALGTEVFVVLSRPGGGDVGPRARRYFTLNASALTNCRQTSAFLSDPAGGSVARIGCGYGQ